MKTFSEVSAWCAGAAQEFGDPSAPICQLFVRWQDDLKATRGDDLVCGWLNGQFVLVLGPDFPPCPLRIETGAHKINARGELVAFGTKRIATGLWAVSPSFNAPGVIHAFLVLYGVPHPAPWERMIVLPWELPAGASSR